MKKWIVISALFIFAAVFTYKTLFAEEGSLSSMVTQKLDQVLQNQTEILKQLNEIKSELQIIKVRASAK